MIAPSNVIAAIAATASLASVKRPSDGVDLHAQF
jgi:hypothetical protein